MKPSLLEQLLTVLIFAAALGGLGWFVYLIANPGLMW